MGCLRKREREKGEKEERRERHGTVARGQAISWTDGFLTCTDSNWTLQTFSEKATGTNKQRGSLGTPRENFDILFIKKWHFFYEKEKWFEIYRISLPRNIPSLGSSACIISVYLQHLGGQEDLCLKAFIAAYEHGLRITSSHSPLSLNIETLFFR